MLDRMLVRRTNSYGGNDMTTPEDILWEAHELGIGEEVLEEMRRIQHHYPHDLNTAYAKAFQNVTASKAEEKQNEDHAN
jgi:hypothetical protein